MPPDATTDADAHFEAAVASLRSFALPPTPQNYAIWFEFHAGRNDKLRRALTVALTNRRSIDGYMMAELHDLFFADSVERRAAREAQATLREAAGRILEAGVDAERYGETLNEAAVTIDTGTQGLAAMISRLAEETTALSTRSAELGQALRSSGDRIAELEKKLAAAHDAALTDALTALPNRRAFDAMVRELAGLAMNSGEEFSLLMLDIDHFKTSTIPAATRSATRCCTWWPRRSTSNARRPTAWRVMAGRNSRCCCRPPRCTRRPATAKSCAARWRRGGSACAPMPRRSAMSPCRSARRATNRPSPSAPGSNAPTPRSIARSARGGTGRGGKPPRAA